MTMMTNLKILLRSSLISFIALLALGNSPKETLSPSALTSEQLQVYGALLNLLNSQPTTQVKNLANQTSPFDISHVPEGSVCLQGIEFENLSQSSRTVHSFSAEITKGRALKIVDPDEQAKIILQQKDSTSPKQKQAEDSAKGSSQSGLLVVSEIAFDKKHQFAVLNYVLFCGSQCKYEVTRVLEKVGGEWTTPVKRVCTVSIN
jgi:hypothetical protein